MPTASRLLNREWKAERQREQQDRSREPSDQERAQSTLPASQAEDREGREDPNWSGTRKTHPPHHLTERAEMKREKQPRTEKAPRRLSRPITSPSVQRWGGRTNQDRTGSRSPPQESNAWIPSPRMNRGDRSELAWTERATRRSSTPPAGPKPSGRRGRTSGSNTRASRDCPPLIRLLKEGRGKKGRPAQARRKPTQRKV